MWGNPYGGKDNEEKVWKFKYAINDGNHWDWLHRHFDHDEGEIWDMKTWLRHLKGKNLACWCRLDQCCHADVLLDLANS